jgi:hypothetical protein
VSTGTFYGTPYAPDIPGVGNETGQNVHVDPESHWGWRLPLPDEFPRNVSSYGYVSTLLIVSGACRLFGFAGYDANTSGEFVLVYDQSTLPASGAVAPIVVSTGTAAGNFSWYGGTAGRYFRRGIYVASSSTAPTYTAVASANMAVDFQVA